MNPNETPEQPAQPVNEQPQTPPADMPAQSAAPVATENLDSPIAASTPVTQGSKAMAVWSLVLAIIGFLTGLLFFISAPLAIIALILGIIVLAKKRSGKGLAIASVIVAGITLLMLPFTMAIVFTAYNGVQEKAQQNVQEAQQREQAE